MQGAIQAERNVSSRSSLEAKCTTTAPSMVRMMASPGAPLRQTVTETTYLEGATLPTVQQLQLLPAKVKYHHESHTQLYVLYSSLAMVTTKFIITSIPLTTTSTATTTTLSTTTTYSGA